MRTGRAVVNVGKAGTLVLSSVYPEAANETNIEPLYWLRRDRNAFHECERTIQRLAGALAMRARELLEKRRLLGPEFVLVPNFKRTRFHCAREGCRQHVSSPTLTPSTLIIRAAFLIAALKMPGQPAKIAGRPA